MITKTSIHIAPFIYISITERAALPLPLLNVEDECVILASELELHTCLDYVDMIVGHYR